MAICAICAICVVWSKLPLFPSKLGMDHQPISWGLYNQILGFVTPNIRIPVIEMWGWPFPTKRDFWSWRILLEQIGGPYLLRQRIVTRLGMIFAKEVDVLSADFSPEHTVLWTKTHGSLPMLELFGGRTRSNTICIYIYMYTYIYM